MRISCWLAALGLAACAQPDTAPPDYGRVPVLLVHGLGENGQVWDALRSGLERDGYPREYVVAVNLEPSGGANAAAAREQLAPAVERLLVLADSLARSRTTTPATRIDIVAHSMGALSARYYATLHPERVRTLLTLAGANHGSDRFCPPTGPIGAAEMCPAFASEPIDAIQVILNGRPGDPLDETPWGVGDDGQGRPHVAPDSVRRIRYATLSAQDEAWIVPDSSTQLRGSGGWTRSDRWPSTVRENAPGRFVVSGADHDDIVRRHATVALVTALLTDGF